MNLNSELYVKNVPLSKKGSIIYLDPAMDIAAIRLYSLLNEFSNHKQMTNIGLLSVLLNEFGLEINGRETLNKLYLYRYISVNNLNKQIEVLLFQYKATINQALSINKHYVNFVCDYHSAHFSDQLYANEISNEVLDLVSENLVNRVYKNKSGENPVESVINDDSQNKSEGVINDDSQNKAEGVINDDSQNKSEGVINDDSQNKAEGVINDDSQNKAEGVINDDSQNKAEGVINDDSQNKAEGVINDDSQNKAEGVINDDSQNKSEGVINGYTSKDPVGNSQNISEGVYTANSQNSVGVINDDASLYAHSENIDLNKSVDTENCSLNTIPSDQQAILLGDFGSLNNSSYASKTHDFNQIDENSLKFNKIGCFDKKVLDTNFDSIEHNYTTTTAKDITNVSKLVSNNNIYKNTYLPTNTTTVISTTDEPLSRSIAQPKNKVTSTNNKRTYSYDDLDWLSVNLSTSNFIYDNFVSRKISFSDAQIVIAVIDQQNQLGLVIHSLSAFLNKLFGAAKKGTLYDPRKLVADRSNQSSSQNKLLENAQLRHHHVTYSNFVENNQHESATLYLKEHNLGWDGRRIYEKQ